MKNISKNAFNLLNRNFFTVGFLFLLADQLIKHNIKNPVMNFGAGFGILQNQRFFLIIVAIAASLLLSYLYFSEKDTFLRNSYLFIIFGILSNLIDRVFLGYVIDYIPFPFWPTFNIGDSMIFIGIVFMILYEFWLKKVFNTKNLRENN